MFFRNFPKSTGKRGLPNSPPPQRSPLPPPYPSFVPHLFISQGRRPPKAKRSPPPITRPSPRPPRHPPVLTKSPFYNRSSIDFDALQMRYHAIARVREAPGRTFPNGFNAINGSCAAAFCRVIFFIIKSVCSSPVLFKV